MGYIYRITNLVNNKSYIGETKQRDVNSRWQNHIQSMKSLYGATALIGAFKKYGLENFKFEVIIVCFDDDRLYYEVEYIKKYNTTVPNGYNISPGRVDTKNFNTNNLSTFLQEKREHSQIIKDKVKSYSVSISEKMQKSERWQKALEEGRVGWNKDGNHKHKDETKKKIADSVKKYYETQSPDACKKNIEKHREAMTKARGKPIEQYTMDDELVEKFVSISRAVRETGIAQNSIQQCLYGKYKHGGGYKWKWQTPQT
jgi:group I intron endonuclease